MDCAPGVAFVSNCYLFSIIGGASLDVNYSSMLQQYIVSYLLIIIPGSVCVP